MLKLLAEKRNSLALSFVSGFADALFFIHLGGLFVGLVTGNVVLIGLGLVGDEKGGLRDLQLMTFPLFMAGAGLAALMVAWIKPLERATVWTVISVAAALAAAALAQVIAGVAGMLVPALLLLLIALFYSPGSAQKFSRSAGAGNRPPSP